MNLEEIKKTYIETQAPEHLKKWGWSDLEKNLTRERYFVPPRFIFLTVVVLVLFFGFTFTQAVNASLPGEPLYSVKRFSEDVVTAVTGDKNVKVENRAQEIIELGHKEDEDSKRVHETVEEYKETVQKLKEEAKESQEEREELQKRLENHEERFREAAKESKVSKDELEEAEEVAREAHEEKSEDEED